MMYTFIKIIEQRCRIMALILLISTFTLSVTIQPASADGDKRIVKVMTYNMDAGTDMLYFFVPDVDSITATQATYLELMATDFQDRAGLLADQIAIEQPYLISLQEVTLWQMISVDQDGVETITDLYDQLNLIMEELAARNLHYKVVISQNLTDIWGPLNYEYSSFLSFLDRNVILARTDLKQSEMALSNIQSGQYQSTISPLPGFPEEVNGWVSVDAKIRGKSLRFFGTHLESPMAPDDFTQYLQGMELVSIMQQSKIPVILAGDFNSDASENGYGPDLTPTAEYIVEHGYNDTWQILHPSELGLTWPLYLEDDKLIDTIYFNNYGIHLPCPSERIDLIFERNLKVLDIETIGTESPYPSDHAGVVATLQIEK